MQTENRFFDDLARVAGGALNTLTGIKGEIEAMVRQQFERILADMNLITRDEFEAVQAMAAKARAEQETLTARVAALEAALAKTKAKSEVQAKAEGAGAPPARPRPRERPLPVAKSRIPHRSLEGSGLRSIIHNNRLTAAVIALRAPKPLARLAVVRRAGRHTILCISPLPQALA